MKKLIIEFTHGNGEVDKSAVFRHWYDLARQLGCCSGQEMRQREQWICMAGTWEKWTAVVDRGYTLLYLKKTIKKSQRQ